MTIDRGGSDPTGSADYPQSIRVKLVLRGGLAAYVASGESEHSLEVPCGTHLVSALQRLGVPTHEVMGALSGEKMKALDEELNEGETLEVFPVISGG